MRLLKHHIRRLFVMAAFAGFATDAPKAAPAAAPPTATEVFADSSRHAKKKRALTAGEIALARSVFGDAIDYSKVRISHGHILLTRKDVPRAPGNCIYMGSRYHDDFSADSLADKDMALFIHEMTHVWQSQNKVLSLPRAAMEEFLRQKGRYSRAYDYKLDLQKDLLDYGIEQQCEIVEHYFLQRLRLQVYVDLLDSMDKDAPYISVIAESVRNIRDDLVAHETVLENFLTDPAYARNWRKLSPVGQAAARENWPRPK